MHDLPLLTTLTVGLGAALLFGYVTFRLGLSPLVGYLLAGVAVGPHTPGFVADRQLAEQLAEFGVILLMFGVGLQFHVEELLAVRRVAVPGALGQCLSATLLGTGVALAFGWGLPAGLLFGLCMSVASTVVLLRVMSDRNDLHTQVGHTAVGWLVVEDLFIVLVLVIVPAVARPGPGGLALTLVWAIAKVALLVLFVGYVGGRFIPWLLTKVAATRSRELFVLTVLAVALGIAVGAAKVFGVSMALGAFLAGMAVGRSDFSARAASEALPLRDAFAVLFFVSAGMLLDPGALIQAPGLALATLAVVLIGKPLGAFALLMLLGKKPRVSLRLAAALAQIGEFSFILAALGRDLQILPPEALNALVAAAIVAISINPILYRLAGRATPAVARWFRAAPPDAPPEIEGAGEARAVVVGYGPVGRTLVRLLRENQVRPTVIELNHDTVKELREAGTHAIYGDASRPETIAAAGVAKAEAFILSSSHVAGSAETIRLAREANPGLHVFARAAYLREVAALRKAGADTVIAGEGEVALAFTELLLRQLGATPEQIDRARDRVRSDLLGDGPAAPA